MTRRQEIEDKVAHHKVTRIILYVLGVLIIVAIIAAMAGSSDEDDGRPFLSDSRPSELVR
ncbi:MAG: hypothetical protein VB860_04030 [Dehalococcoidia bacterium]